MPGGLTVNCKYNQPYLKKQKSEKLFFIRFSTVRIYHINRAKLGGGGICISLLGSRLEKCIKSCVQSKHANISMLFLKLLFQRYFKDEISSRLSTSYLDPAPRMPSQKINKSFCVFFLLSFFRRKNSNSMQRNSLIKQNIIIGSNNIIVSILTQ